jgi:hypothetical protein
MRGIVGNGSICVETIAAGSRREAVDDVDGRGVSLP